MKRREEEMRGQNEREREKRERVESGKDKTKIDRGRYRKCVVTHLTTCFVGVFGTFDIDEDEDENVVVDAEI